MRAAVSGGRNIGRGRIAKSVQVAFPVKGWTAQNSPVEAEAGTALILDNWFPEAEGGRLRRGYEQHSWGMVNTVQSLMVYTSATASRMFAAAGSTVYNASASGHVGTGVEISGLTNAEFQHTMFATAAGQFLVICNGEDSVRNYDGAAWSTPSITNVASSTLIDVTAHKFRLWFAQAATTDLWYLPTVSVAGAATKFSLGAVLRRGGYIMKVGSWSVDSGSGMDDLFFAWSSEGEVVVYQGTDPASANTWALVGVYLTGKPLGRRSVYPIGGDVALITEDGVVALSQLLTQDRSVANRNALTAKIRQAYADAVKRSRDTFGWQVATHPVRNMAILNVPGSSAVDTSQFVLNTITGAWCRFTNMDAVCWATFDNSIYFGVAGGIVMKADTGGLDDGYDIEAACLPSYMHLDAKGFQKHVKMVEPIFTSDVPGLAPSVTIAVDYALPDDVDASAIDVDGYFTWGVSTWGGPDVWFGGQTFMQWRGNGNIGRVISPYTTVGADASSGGSDYRFFLTGWTVVYETGGIL